MSQDHQNGVHILACYRKPGGVDNPGVPGEPCRAIAAPGKACPRTVNHYSCPETLCHGKVDFLEKQDLP